jgi:hypothetical protein
MRGFSVVVVATLAGAWGACGDRSTQDPNASGSREFVERFLVKKQTGAAEEWGANEAVTMEFDTWRFRIGFELPEAAVILGEDAWLVTRQLPPLAQTREAEEHGDPISLRYRLYRQSRGAEDEPLLAHAWSVAGGIHSLDAARDGEHALVAWRETIGGKQKIGLRLVGNARLLGDAWHVSLPRGVDPRREVLVASRPGSAGWVVCVGTFEGPRDDKGIRCASVGPGAAEVGTWHRLTTEWPAELRWLGPIAGSLYLIVADDRAPERIAILPLEPDGSVVGAPIDLSAFTQMRGAFVHIIPIPDGVLFYDSTNRRTVFWDGLEFRMTRNPGGLVGFEHGGVMYMAIGGHPPVTGAVVWDEESGESNIHPWPAVVHEFLGAGIGHHILPASDNGVVLTGAPVDIHHVLIVRPRP